VGSAWLPASPLELLRLSGTAAGLLLMLAVGRKLEEKNKTAEKNVLPRRRRLREATATRLLRYHTRRREAMARRKKMSTRQRLLRCHTWWRPWEHQVRITGDDGKEENDGDAAAALPHAVAPV